MNESAAVLLAFACLCFSAQFIFVKLFQKSSVKGLQSASVMTASSSLVMVLFLLPVCGFRPEITLSSAALSLLYALSFSVCGYSSVFAMNYGNLAAITTSMTVGGMVLPFLFGCGFLGETVTAAKIAGISVIALSPVVALAGKRAGDGGKVKNRLPFAILCGLVFAGNGCLSVASKANAVAAEGVGTNDFLLACAVLQLLFSGSLSAVMTYRATKSGGGKPLSGALAAVMKNPSRREALLLAAFASCYALLNMTGNMFSLACARTADSTVQFPVLSAAIIILTSIIGWIFFGERPSRGEAAGILLAAGGIISYILI